MVLFPQLMANGKDVPLLPRTKARMTAKHGYHGERIENLNSDLLEQKEEMKTTRSLAQFRQKKNV